MLKNKFYRKSNIENSLSNNHNKSNNDSVNNHDSVDNNVPNGGFPPIFPVSKRINTEIKRKYETNDNIVDISDIIKKKSNIQPFFTF